MFTQTPMGLESLESAIKYESAVAKHGRAIVDQALAVAHTSFQSFDDALNSIVNDHKRGELPQRRYSTAIVVESGTNRHERRKAAKLGRSKR